MECIDWTAISAIGQLLCAIATAWAVIVTLRITRKANEKVIKVKFDEKLDKKTGCPGVVISNEGQRLVEIHDWGFIDSTDQKHTLTGAPRHLIPNNSSELPAIIESNRSIKLFCTEGRFITEIQKCYSEKKSAGRPLSIYVEDAAGECFKIKTTKPVSDYIKEYQ